MRILEVTISLLLGIYLLWPLITRAPYRPPVNSLPIVTAAVLLLHLLIEKYRWQMIPLYILTGVILVTSLLFSWRGHSGPPSPIITLPVLLLLLVAAALPALLPIPKIPAPSGDYQVGTASFMLVDESRRELYSGRDEPRRLMVQVWYPALRGNSVRAPWTENAEIVAKATSLYLKFPPYFLDHLALAHSPAWQDAAPDSSGAPYPIIIFSHGWNGFRAQNTSQMVELASRGYVAVAIDHTYGNIVTVFPDGQTVYNNPAALPQGASEAEYDAAARLLVEQWSGDIGFVLDTLAADQVQGPARPIAGLLDFERIGVLGHSTGGGAAIQFCGTDARCKALFPMDAFMTPVSLNVLGKGISQPALFVFSQQWADDRESKNNRLFRAFYEHVAQPAPVITILGSEHYDFSDLPAISPLAPQLGLKGPINGKRVQQILREFTAAFFDRYLKNTPTDLFDGPSPSYPELRWDNQ